MTSVKKTGTTAKPADKQDQPTKPKRSFIKRLNEKIGAMNMILIISIIVLVAVFGIANPNFFLPSNLSIIGQSVAIMGILSITQMVVIIMGGIDMTVGSVAGLASVACAMLFERLHNSGLSILLTLLLGMLCGLITAIVVVYGRVPPMVATLAAPPRSFPTAARRATQARTRSIPSSRRAASSSSRRSSGF